MLIFTNLINAEGDIPLHAVVAIFRVHSIVVKSTRGEERTVGTAFQRVVVSLLRSLHLTLIITNPLVFSVLFIQRFFRMIYKPIKKDMMLTPFQQHK